MKKYVVELTQEEILNLLCAVDAKVELWNDDNRGEAPAHDKKYMLWKGLQEKLEPLFKRAYLLDDSAAFTSNDGGKTIVRA